MLDIKTMKEVFPDWFNGGGIFKNMLNVPWDSMHIAPIQLDQIYFGTHSGDKIISSLLSNFVIEGVVPTGKITDVADMVSSYFSINWKKLYNTLSLEYSPIQNYDMTETEHGTNTDAKNTSLTSTSKNKNTDITVDELKHIGSDSEVEEIQRDVTNTDNVFAFNSSEATPSAAGIGMEKNKNTRTVTPGVADTRSINLTSEIGGEKTDTGEDTLKGESDRTLKRSGNIGVTTSQQMIEAERNVWKWDFFNSVFKDVDALLTLSIY